MLPETRILFPLRYVTRTIRGKYSDATYESVVRLTAWLCTQLKLKSSDVVRHYDINGKLCPKYYVEHEEEWKQLRKDIDAAMKEL